LDIGRISKIAIRSPGLLRDFARQTQRELHADVIRRRGAHGNKPIDIRSRSLTDNDSSPNSSSAVANGQASEMTSIVNINRWRRQRLRRAESRHDDAPHTEHSEIASQSANRKGFVATMLKTIRLTFALAIILAIEIGDFMFVKIGRIR
jgi:hypothetical protein